MLVLKIQLPAQRTTFDAFFFFKFIQILSVILLEGSTSLLQTCMPRLNLCVLNTKTLAAKER